MATSSIFAHVKISGEENVRRFVEALEESEKAVAKMDKTPSSIRVLRDPDEIREFMSKRFPKK